MKLRLIEDCVYFEPRLFKNFVYSKTAPILEPILHLFTPGKLTLSGLETNFESTRERSEA
ncbi:MAG: hypothetical protein JSU95_04750 [Betaproteobacteria bacterium]|nr:MAG: hypothetical protein JSU95_04750 [Betaproteobacteria bacterium]